MIEGSNLGPWIKRGVYRKAALEICPDITARERLYCWRACIPIWAIPDKVAQLRYNEAPKAKRVPRTDQLVYVDGVPKLRAHRAKRLSRADELVYVDGVPKLRAPPRKGSARIRPVK